jgi:hypothetical protein
MYSFIQQLRKQTKDQQVQAQGPNGELTVDSPEMKADIIQVRQLDHST